MNLHDLGHVPWLDSQLIYHALPRIGAEGLLILAPREPYVCIGWHQDLEQEVDLPYCREHGIPVFRREVGGGAVYLDGRQVFFQLVLHRDNPLAGGDKAAFYRRMLQPVADAYADMGVPARYRPINDVVTAEGRKISGTGAAEIGESLVLVGNLIEDFDYDTMAHVLRVPDEKFRDKVFASMRENLTTLRRETGRAFGWTEMVGPLVRRFAQVLGPLEPAPLPQAVRGQVEALASVVQDREWLFRRGGGPREKRDVKIATGVNVVQRVHKGQGGLLRAQLEVREGRIEHVSLSGDFFCYPQGRIEELERMLQGVRLEHAGGVLSRFYGGGKTETPGIAISDWLTVLGAGAEPVPARPAPPPPEPPTARSPGSRS